MQHNEIEESSSRWFWRLGGGLLALAVVAAGGFLLQMKLAGGSTKTEPYEEYTVGTMTLRAMVTSSGVAVAQDEAVLSFSGAGQLSEILVNLGDTVREGQPLMRLKSDDLENAAATAASSLTLAKLELQKLQEGASTADLSDADRAVATARSALTKAQNDLKDTLDPATQAQVTKAQGDVATAEANLASAKARRDTLEGGSTDTNVADAEANLTAAQVRLSEAERAQSDSESNESNMQSAFENAAKRYCHIADNGNVCEDPSYDKEVDAICEDIDYYTPLSDDAIDDISSCVQPPDETPTPTPTSVPSPTATGTPDPTATRTPRPTPVPINDIEQASGYLTSANTNYRNAITASENADDNVVAAQANVDAAQVALDDLNEGASQGDLDAANEAVISAQAALNAAQAALDDLLDGAKSTVTGSLSAAVDQAEAGLAAAQAERDKVISGATSTEIAIQQEEVHRAELELQQADIALNDATLTSPFDGTVSALPVKLGQVLNPAIPAITILTPGQLIFELNVGETELPSIKVGQVGGLLFDAIQGKPYTIQIFAIGLSPDTEQGVIIYKVKCKINGNLNDPSGPNPAPGMNGSASIVTEQRPNVIAIPSAAVHSRGNEQVVDLIKDDGTIESRPVVTGLSDGDNIEITSGLEVGDKVALRTAAASSGAKQTPLPGGIQ